MIFAAILAGGIGSRMGIESMPKQFLPLGTKPVFLHTLEKFMLCDEFDAIFIGVHRDWVDFVQNKVLEEYSVGEAGHIRVIAGGSDRNGTIMNIVDGIEDEFGPSDGHVIVTHDSVRPFVKMSTIKANIEAMATYDACDTVIPATDTIVKSIDGTTISAIPVRSEVYQGQTPQTFRVNALKEIYRQLDEGKRALLTDACKIFVLNGRPVGLVEGDVTNIKLTTVMDYKVAQAMVDSEGLRL